MSTAARKVSTPRKTSEVLTDAANDNGGTATVASFTLTANGTGANDLSGSSPVDSGATLQADTWTLSEVGPAGYTASAWTCVGGTQLSSKAVRTFWPSTPKEKHRSVSCRS